MRDGPHVKAQESAADDDVGMLLVEVYAARRAYAQRFVELAARVDLTGVGGAKAFRVLAQLGIHCSDLSPADVARTLDVTGQTLGCWLDGSFAPRGRDRAAAMAALRALVMRTYGLCETIDDAPARKLRR